MDNILDKPDKKAIKVLSAGHFISDSYGGFITPIMPLLAANLHISLGIVGFLLTLSSLASSLLQPLFGYISDGISRRFFILFGILCSTIFISLSGYVHNVFMLGLIVFFGSMGVGLFHPQATALTGHFSGREINKFMGIFTACGTIGYAFGPFLSSFLVQNFGLNSTILVLLPGIAVTYFIYKILPKAPLKMATPNFLEVWKTLLKLKRMLLTLVFISIVRGMVVVSFNVFMPFIWKAHHFSILTIGTLIALFSVFGGIASYFGGKLTNSIGGKSVLALSLIPLIPCLFGTLYFVNSIPILSFVLFVMSGFIINSSSSVNIVIAQTAAPENMGIVSGIVGGFSWGLAGIIMTPVGFIANHYGIESVLYSIAITPILGVLAVFFIPKKHAV